MFRRTNVLADARLEIIESLQSQVEQLVYKDDILGLQLRVKELEGQLALAQMQARIAEQRLAELQRMQPSPVPLYMSEEEEDLNWLKKTGKIDTQQYEEMLEAAGMANTEIEFAAEDYPRLSVVSPSP